MKDSHYVQYDTEAGWYFVFFKKRNSKDEIQIGSFETEEEGNDFIEEHIEFVKSYMEPIK